ncbi:MAG: ABC transporter ATP-binding protein [Anaerolineaceae bacterium]|nr:ABC transporter ATP-binding protein [Anaerolineaceae bacterium]
MDIITFEHVSKCYQLGNTRTSLREAIMQRSHALFHSNASSDKKQLFWALNDVTFQVKQGEVMGLIGHNGAGKSTILKILSKVTHPTSGTIHTQGRIAGLIELGAGFHPDLTGRENIYLNGSILGLKRSEIDKDFSNIVEFAGLEQFIDTPIKRYSSGMYVRLAFAVAAHVKADLLLVDEVLSVGDMDFQQKSLAKMNELRDGGTTILFVSHNLWSISSFCNKAILLNHGKVERVGDTEEIIQLYRHQEKLTQISQSQENTDLPESINVSSANELTGLRMTLFIRLTDIDNHPGHLFTGMDRIKIHCDYQASGCIPSPIICVRIRRSDGLVCCSLWNNREYKTVQPDLEGNGSFEVTVGPLLLNPDYYTLEVQVIDNTQPLVYATSIQETFQIDGYLSGELSGVFTPDTEWKYMA